MKVFSLGATFFECIEGADEVLGAITTDLINAARNLVQMLA